MEAATAARQVRERAHRLGFQLVGFGSGEPFERERGLILESLARGHLAGMGWITPERVKLSCDPEALLPGARSIVALGLAYDGAAAEPGDDGGPRGRVARYAGGRDYHDVIRPRLHELAEAIVELGGPQTRCRVFVDTGPLVERAAAVRTGLGFIGKNTCLLTGPLGSYVLLSAILTTVELPPDPLVMRDCGSCRACIDACPTQAIVAPGELDATRCISYLTIEHRGTIGPDLRPKMGDWVFGCDVCQEVCPWNRGRPGSAAMESEVGASNGASSLDLIELLALDDASFRARFRGTALTRPKRSGLLRNAAVALGNAQDPRAVPALAAALADPEPLVRGHAAWALAQISPPSAEVTEALRQALAVETDAEARAELEGALSQVGAR
jgi:epoxyqueuosine reductase